MCFEIQGLFNVSVVKDLLCLFPGLFNVMVVESKFVESMIF